jgi:hypothetical protein
MRVSCPWLLTLLLPAIAACSRGAAPAPARVQRDGGPTASTGTSHPDAGLDGGSPRSIRAEVRPLTRFQLVPVGEAALGPARAALEPLRARYVAYGFALGALQAEPVTPGDCGELLRRQVGARGTIFVVAGTVRCPTPFGSVDSTLATGLVSLGTLGPSGPVADRRLTALLASMVGELLGLSMPCTDGRTCCPLRTAHDVKALEARAALRCPAHDAELDRIREAAGMQ